MKKITFFLTFLFCAVALSCGSDNDEDPNTGGDISLTCVPSEINASATGGTYTLNVKCDRGEWTAYASDDSKSWIAVSVSGSLKTEGTVTVTVNENKGDEARNGSVVVKSGNKNITVPVTQSASMSVSETSLYSASTGETFTLNVSSVSEWNVTSNENWIIVEKAGNASFTLTTKPNDLLTTRTGTADVVSGQEKITITVVQNSAEDRDITAPEGYMLVWHDEFNEGTALNGNSWTHEVQNAGWVNNELQNYVNGQADGKRVTELSDGRLRINCFKGSDGKVYSGRVYANVNTGWQYGYIEARIKLPKGKGTWPAFWMMPCNVDWATEPWPYCGEIDIMEEVGCVPNEVSSSLHASGHNHTNNTQITHAMTIDNAEGEFHVYALEWTAKRITTYVDGKVQLRYDNPNTESTADPKWNWPYDRPYYIILNLAWGGSWGGMNGVDESALPVTMEVDYVRVFQKR